MLETLFKICIRVPQVIVSRTTLYLSNSSIHGLRYIVDHETFILEKLIWLIMCSLSMFGTFLLFQSTLQTYWENPISIATETTYLDWKTPFPAIYICEHKEYGKIDAFARMLYADEYENKYAQLFNDYLFYDGTCAYCYTFCVRRNQTCDVSHVDANLQRFYYKCDKLITNCKWNNESFNCCDYFLPIYTEQGYCYAVNSMHSSQYQNAPKYDRKLHFYSNLSTGPGTMTLELTASAKTHIRSPEETLLIDGGESNEWSKASHVPCNHLITYKATEIVNDPDLVAEVPIEARGCLFHSERQSQLFGAYAFSTCIVECHMEAAIKECGCIPYIYSKIAKMRGSVSELNYTECDVPGLWCVNRQRESIYQVRSMNYNEKGIECNCLPSCEETEYAIPLNDVQYLKTGTKALLTISADSLSKERFIRNIVRTKLDLVVSLGGAAGLFLGASLLSVVEIVYYCCIYRNRTTEELWYNSKQKPALLKKLPKTITRPEEKTWLDEAEFRKPFTVRPPGYYPTDFPKFPKDLEY